MENLIIAILGVVLVLGFVYFWIQIDILKGTIQATSDSNDRLNEILIGLCDTMSDFSGRLEQHTHHKIPTEVASRLGYITDPTAQKLWNFLVDYQKTYEDKFGDTHHVIPSFRVLDALSMINQDKIEYRES